MKNMLVAVALVSTLAACGKKTDTPAVSRDTPRDVDNTAMNKRDRDGAMPTPGDQKNNDADLKTSQEIRKLVVGAKLSTDAENVKIVATNGRVTLRGPVKTQAEKDTIVSLARQVAGAANVDDQLEVETNR
jgi:hyperosmotically inducible protein